MVAELCAGVKQVYKLAFRLMGVATQAQRARGSLDEGASWLKLTSDDGCHRDARACSCAGDRKDPGVAADAAENAPTDGYDQTNRR